MKSEKVWICGQILGKWKKSGSAWAFQGVFNNKLRARKACKNSSCFIFSARMNEELPEESVLPEEFEYPKN